MYNPELQICDYSTNVPECDSTATGPSTTSTVVTSTTTEPSTTIISTTTTKTSVSCGSPPDNFVCPGDGNYPYAVCCGQYWSCSSGQSYLQVILCFSYVGYNYCVISTFQKLSLHHVFPFNVFNRFAQEFWCIIQSWKSAIIQLMSLNAIRVLVYKVQLSRK